MPKAIQVRKVSCSISACSMTVAEDTRVTEYGVELFKRVCAEKAPDAKPFDHHDKMRKYMKLGLCHKPAGIEVTHDIQKLFNGRLEAFIHM